MGRIPSWLLRHRLTIEPYTGTWGSYGPARVVRVFLDERLTTAAVNAGVERVATVTVFAAPDEVLPEGSRCTLPDGRRGYIGAAARLDGGGLPTPDHVQAAVHVATQYGPAYGETVVLLRRTPTGTKDRYGNDRYATTEVPIAGAAVRPLSSQEDVASERRDRITDSLEVILPPDTVVTATDRLRVRGLVYEVDGTPDEQYSSVTGAEPGVRVIARRVTG